MSHIVARLTATLEEAAIVATLLARGVQVEDRLQESRRTGRAFLDAWPDKPHFDITRTLLLLLGPMNAIGLYAFGIVHGQEHLDQLRETVRQSTSSEDL